MQGYEEIESELTELAKNWRLGRDRMTTLLNPLLTQYASTLASTKAALKYVDDAVQQALMQLPKVMESHVPGQPLAPLMYRVTRFRFQDLVRAARVRERSTVRIDGESTPEPADSRQPVETLIDNEATMRLMARVPGCWNRMALEAVALLVLSCRELPTELIPLSNDFDAFLGLVQQGRPLKEVMTILGQPTERSAAMKAKLVRARRQLLECLGVL